MSTENLTPNPQPEPGLVKRIFCLANSRKISGRCVAGLEVADGQSPIWIRPISDRLHQEISEEERRYQDGSDLRVLDVVDIPLIGHRPHSFQQENWLIDPQFYWVKRGRLNWVQLQRFREAPARLWVNGSSSYSGSNNRVALTQAELLDQSLRFIHVDKIEIEVLQPGAVFGNTKRRVEAEFQYAGEHYRLRVTDPVYEKRYFAQSNGRYRLGEAFLTVSLGEPFEGYAYKLVAAIIERADIEVT